MPDIIDAAVDRMETANRRQRRVVSATVVLLFLFVIVFQIVNRASFLDGQAKANHDAEVQRAAFGAKLDEQGKKLDEANMRIGQLEGALVAAGVTIPPLLAHTTTTTAPTTPTGRPSAPPAAATSVPERPPGPAQPSSTSTTTTAPPPSTTTTTTCILAGLGRCLP